MLGTVAKTSDDKLVISGVYKMYETDGLPLDVIFAGLQEKKAVPDWLSFFIDAIRAGMKPDRIYSKLSPAISDVYGSEFRDVVIGKLKEFNDSVPDLK